MYQAQAASSVRSERLAAKPILTGDVLYGTYYYNFAIGYDFSMTLKVAICLVLVNVASLTRQTVVQDLKNRLLSAVHLCIALGLHISIDCPASQS